MKNMGDLHQRLGNNTVE